MDRLLESRYRLNWRAAALLGLISSTFSTLVSQFLAARIGRDAVVDWMVVATIPFRDGMLQSEPSWPVIAAGILFHQWADFTWAIIFFGLFGPWTANLKPQSILLIALPWALLTSASEWFVLVPLVPFWQPVFTLNQPYWIGFLVHALSALMYPLFPWLRDWLKGRLPSPHGRFTAAWGSLAAASLLVLGLVAFLGWQNRELPWMGGNPVFDQAYMRRMAAHHAQGVELAELAIEKAQDQSLKNAAHLMAADQKGEIAIFQQWWRSWFEGDLPPASPEEHAAMPGMLSPEQMDGLRHADGDAFDSLFIRLVTAHHQGAIVMADEALREADDIRLRLMAHATRHAQRGEIELMHGSEGLAAVKAATMSLFAPMGDARPDRRESVPSTHRH